MISVRAKVLKSAWKWVETVSIEVFGVVDHEYDIEIFRALFRKRWAWPKFMILFYFI
jgi:hypothetical protein